MKSARQPDKQTIVVVHGTQLSKPQKSADGKVHWWAPGSDFAQAVDKELKAQDLPACCWKHLKPGEEGFAWDGRNNWYSRAVTADRLRDYVRRLTDDGWLVHVVAHSHGGNVVMDALTKRGGETLDWYKGRICLLGTPVLNRSNEYFKARDKLLVWALGFTCLLLAGLAWWFGLGETRVMRELPFHDMFGFAVVVLVFLVPVLVAMRIREFTSPPDHAEAVRRAPQLLLIGSRKDEAFKFLKVARTAELPGHQTDAPAPAAEAAEPDASRVAVPVARAAWRTTRSRLLYRYSWDDLPDFLVVGLLFGGGCGLTIWGHGLGEAGVPMGFLEASLWVVLLLALVGYGVRRSQALFKICALPIFLIWCGLSFSWGLITGLTIKVLYDRIVRTVVKIGRHLAFGLLGGPVAVRYVDVGLWPSWRAENWLYLELPEASVQKVREAQGPKLAELAQELYFPYSSDAGAVDFDEITKKLGLPLVHSAYHSGESTCPQVIARWVGMGEAEKVLESFSQRVRHSIRGNAGVLEDMKRSPFMESWNDALLRIYRPEEGWVCVPPSRIASELQVRYLGYEDATMEEYARLHELGKELVHPDTHLKAHEETPKDEEEPPEPLVRPPWHNHISPPRVSRK